MNLHDLLEHFRDVSRYGHGYSQISATVWFGAASVVAVRRRGRWVWQV